MAPKVYVWLWQDLLKDKGQSTKGKKEDLVKRLMDFQNREAMASRPH